MVTGFPLCGIVLLTGLYFRMTSPVSDPAVQDDPVVVPPAPTDSIRVSTDTAPATSVTVAPAASVSQASEVSPPPVTVSLPDSEPLEFFGSQSEPKRPEPIEPPAALTESELLTSLENAAVEIDLYNDPGRPQRDFDDFVKEVTTTTQRLLAEITELRQLLNNPTRLTSGSQALLKKVPGAVRNMEQAMDETRERLKAQLDAAEGFEPLRGWLTERHDLAGLPLTMDEDCRLESRNADALAAVSNGFGRKRSIAFREKTRRVSRSAAPLVADELQPTLGNANRAFAESVDRDPDAFRDSLHEFGHDCFVPGLTQIMQGFPEHMRLLMMDTVAGSSSEAATQAIAGRAVFDPSSAVREAAVAELHHRDAQTYRPVLLTGLHYVWPPAAQHAADALVALNDQEARSDLIDLTELPDPTKPVQNESEEWYIHELTRVNHMRNCLLCHAPVVEASVQPTGAIPDPYQPVTVRYYGSAVPSPSRLGLVRADVTYLRQDFSTVHKVEDPGPWSKQQRFDYFVRARKLTRSEAHGILNSRNWDDDYPQKRSVLWALQELDAMDTRRVVAQTRHERSAVQN